MNIILFTGLYPPAGGGAERVMARLARGLMQLGHKVTVITLHGQVAMESDDSVGMLTMPDRRAYPYAELAQHSTSSRYAWHLADLLDRDQARRAVLLAKQQKAELVITGNIKGLGGLLPVEIRAAGFKHIHVVHDVQPVEPSGLLEQSPVADGARMTLARWVWVFLMRRVWRSPAAVVFPSEWLRAFCAGRGLFPQSRQVVARNPAGDGDKQAPQARPSTSPGVRLLFVGHLEPHKGIRELVEAVRALPDIDLSLDVVGDGSLRMELERTKSDKRIRFHGRLFGEALTNWYSQADALVVPSRVAENAPLVVVDALLRRLPVIATPVGGVPELVISGETGWLAWPERPDFAAAVAALRREKQTPTLRWQQLPDTPTPQAYAARVLASLEPAT